MAVPMTSINAYYELKEEGKISERQELAFMTVRKFYEEKGYWPTPKEVHAFLAVEQGNEMAQFEGPNLVKPRISELIEDPDDDYPDLLEKKQESRKQEYIEELLDDYDSKKATPVKIAESVVDRTDPDQESSEEDGAEQEEEDQDPVIVPSEDSEDTEPDNQDNDEDSESEDPDTGDVIFGTEDSEDDVDEQEEDSEDEDGGASMVDENGDRYERNEDGFWEDEEGNEYVLRPDGFQEASKEEEDGDSEDQEEEQEADGEKQQKQPSLNEI